MSYYNNQNRPYSDQPSVNTKIRTIFTDDAMLTISYWNDMISCKLSAATLDAQGGKHYRKDGLTFALNHPRAMGIASFLEKLLDREITTVEFDTGADKLTHIKFFRDNNSNIVMTIIKYNDGSKVDSQTLSITFPYEEIKVSETENIRTESEFRCLTNIFKGVYVSSATIIHGLNMNNSRTQYHQTKTYSNGQYYNNPNGWSNQQQQTGINQANSIDDIFGGINNDNDPF